MRCALYSRVDKVFEGHLFQRVLNLKNEGPFKVGLYSHRAVTGPGLYGGFVDGGEPPSFH